MSAYSDLNVITWAQKNFENIPIGDKRRIQRVIDIAQHMATFPGKSIPQLFNDVYGSCSNSKRNLFYSSNKMKTILM